MAIRRRKARKRRGPNATESPDEGGEADRGIGRTGPDDDDLAARLDSVSSRFKEPPSPEELRAAFGRKRSGDRDDRPGDFEKTFPTETLFSPTIEEPTETPFAEDRSKTRGDYFYDPDDAWGVLGLPVGASWPEILNAHRKLAMVHHPDRLLEATEEERSKSEETMREINVAYSVLRRLTGN